MDDEKAEAKKASQPTSGGLANVVKLVVKTFLEEKHYRQLNRILSVQWAGTHSLTAVVRLMEAHGIKVTPEEEEQLQGLSEERMIDALVMRMPNQSREQYEHFFLQLSFIASTSTRLRAALETGNPDVVEEALDSAENVGVLQYLLRMAVSHAGSEVQTIGELHDQWLSDTERRMMPLLQAQATQMATQKSLAQARALIGGFMNQTKECGRGFLTSMLNEMEQATLVQTFVGWKEHVKWQQREAVMTKEWQEKKAEASKRLDEYKSAQLQRVHTVAYNGIKDKEMAILGTCFAALLVEAINSKETKTMDVEAEELVRKLRGFADEAAVKAKNVLSRMTDGNVEGLKAFAFKAWIDFKDIEREERETNARIQASRDTFAAYTAKQAAGAKAVLQRMCGNSDTSLMHLTMQGWREAIVEQKREAEMEEVNNNKKATVSSFVTRNKSSAMNASERAAYWRDLELTTYLFCIWKRESKVERMRRYGKERNEKRKKDLVSVKGLFRNFASELESSLKQGTPRIEAAPRRMAQNG